MDYSGFLFWGFLAALSPHCSMGAFSGWRTWVDYGGFLFGVFGCTESSTAAWGLSLVVAQPR